jgi:hypothetical protein
MLLRSEYLVDAKPISKVAGLPFTAGEIESEIRKALGEVSGGSR